ncbi:MAG: cytochrome c oxidase accessory protein CcoG, partial [Alphaproteobacteria bacterium]|nr:cytochrome c oxidase accessory protein CcoG [Alphaproteobacteria bacterium]
FDKDTLIISYDEARGEPRGKHKAGSSWEGRGHCIDCDSCVVVCPMGIDIREGLQMECIACGLCVDACNNVMDKIGLPHGLIHYDTASKTPFRLFRIRTFWYASIITVVGGLMLYTLLTRSPLELNIIHDRNPLFVTLSDGSVRNGDNIAILNKSHEDRVFSLEVQGLKNVELRVQGSQDMDPSQLPVFADSVGHFRVFLAASGQSEPRTEIEFTITEQSKRISVHEETIFVSGDK